jgi:hypothetical protein
MSKTIIEQGGIHGGDNGGHKLIKCSTFKKEEREKQLWNEGKGIR